MQVSKVALKETKVTMNPNDSHSQQPVAPPDPAQPQESEKKRRKAIPVLPVWFSAAPAGMSEADFHHDRLHLPIVKWVKRSTVVLLALAIILGTGYGLLSINKETNRLTAAAAAELAKDQADSAVNYRGNGDDILKTAAPQVIYECPAGFTKKSAESDDCIKNAIVTVSGAKYSCEIGQTLTGSGTDTKCLTRENPTLQTVAAAMVTSCDTGFTPSGNNCVKKESLAAQKQYLCTGSQVPAGTGDQTVCSVAPAALIITCPAGFGIAGSGCSKSTAAISHVSYATCKEYYYLSAPAGQCRRPADITGQAWCGPYSGFTLSGNSCVRTVNKAVTGYYCPPGYSGTTSCTKSVTQSPSKGKCPAGWTSITEHGIVDQCRFNYPTISGTPEYGGCSGFGTGYVSINTTQCKRTISPAASHNVYYCSLAGEGPFDYGPGAGSGCYMNLAANVWYTCTVGSVSGANCIQTAAASYSCPAGYAQRGSGPGSACPNSSAPVSAPTVKIVCTTGYLPVGEGCEKTTTTTGKKVVGCEDDSFTFTAEDSKCRRTVGGKEVTVEPKVSYACDPDQTPSGSGEALKCSKQELQTQKIQKILKCEDGWKKRTATDGTVDCVLVKVDTTPVE